MLALHLPLSLIHFESQQTENTSMSEIRRLSAQQREWTTSNNTVDISKRRSDLVYDADAFPRERFKQTTCKSISTEDVIISECADYANATETCVKRTPKKAHENPPD